MTSLYTAIMKAADHIERHPDLFNFRQCAIPGDCGTPGCALGWINYFANTESPFGLIQSKIFGDTDHGTAFYNRMDTLEIARWRANAADCAFALRLYAEKYHGHEKPQPPNWNTIASGHELVKEKAVSEELTW